MLQAAQNSSTKLLDDAYIVIDEAHNIVDKVCDFNSRTVTKVDINKVFNLVSTTEFLYPNSLYYIIDLHEL